MSALPRWRPRPVLWLALPAFLLSTGAALADPPPPAPTTPPHEVPPEVEAIPARPGDSAADADAVADDGASDEPTPDDPAVTGFTPAAGADAPAFTIAGYVDVGFAKAQGNGTSFPANDFRLPVDYGVDPFAPAVNSRGDVASTDTGGRFANGFLPRSVNAGGRPTFLLNVVNVDLRYQPTSAPLLVFTRLQMLPRFFGRGQGDGTQLFVDQAFGRVTPFAGRELFLAVGKFDSVFGIEYLDNPANIRVGVTPSLLARYTTGTSLGAKLFYRLQLAPLWSALSLNVAATNSGNFVEALQPPDVSLTGRPVFSGRFGYELNLPSLQLKLGASGMTGPRNDQFDRSAVQTMYGFDARLYAYGFSAAGEWVHVNEDPGSTDKQTSLGEFPLSSEFRARGFWGQLAYTIPLKVGALRGPTLYGRYERRRAWFKGFRKLQVERVTAGVRLDLWDSVIVKAEVLVNNELEGAPKVDNNIYTSSVVFAW